MTRSDHVVVPLTTAEQQASFYDDVLVPSFPPHELDDRDELLASLRDAGLVAHGILDGGRVAAGVMTLRDAGVALVMYLAAGLTQRSGGRGGALLDHAVSEALAHGATMVLVEIEHPAHHRPHPEHGDPTARLRFYARHGLRVLAVPYFQPALGPGRRRVPALLLGLLGVTDRVCLARGPAGAPTAIQSAPVTDFLRRHLIRSEGSLGTDDAVRRLLTATRGRSLAVVSPDDLEAVPVGMLDSGTDHAPPRSSTGVFSPGSAGPGPLSCST